MEKSFLILNHSYSYGNCLKANEDIDLEINPLKTWQFMYL